MPLVFVHGVSNRLDATYRQTQAMRNRYFQEIALAGTPASGQSPLNPYWGDLGAFMAWGDEACLPLEQNQTFGGGSDDILRQVLGEMAPDIIAPPNKMLLTLARKDLSRAVDALWAAATHTIPASGASNPDALAAMAVRAVEFVKTDPQPSWLQSVTDDDQFVDEFLTRLDAFRPPATPQTQTFGASDVWNHLKETTARLAQATVGFVSDTTQAVSNAAKDLGQAAAGAVINPLVRAARPGTNKRAILFLGDIFAYLADRGTPGKEGKIVRLVAGDFDRAAASRGTEDPLIIVAHSMGGIISYDILSYFRANLVCDLFVTVGSQVGTFAELGLLAAVPVDRSAPPDPNRPKAKVPANIRRWINVFDPADVLGFKADGVFDRVEDYAFSSNVSSLTAHGMYFERPHFYERLRARDRGEKP